MFQNLKIFSASQAMAQHAGARQAVTAANIANADTPGYQARDIPPFTTQSSSESQMRASRAGHLHGHSGSASSPSSVSMSRTLESAPNGNTVSIEQEMLRSVDAKRQHDRALAIYKSALKVVRGSLGQ